MGEEPLHYQVRCQGMIIMQTINIGTIRCSDLMPSRLSNSKLWAKTLIITSIRSVEGQEIIVTILRTIPTKTSTKTSKMTMCPTKTMCPVLISKAQAAQDSWEIVDRIFINRFHPFLLETSIETILTIQMISIPWLWWVGRKDLQVQVWAR